MPIVLKSGSLDLLGPSGPVQACNGIVLPFIIVYININLCMHHPEALVEYIHSPLGQWLDGHLTQHPSQNVSVAQNKEWPCGENHH